ncbi:GLRA2-like protein [Mya arenaria]|uniref:GLRA2-like protein n=1 Tax=Mya arenaria TaxID=6604 RepID=A0ABY7DNH5_MYAAR|nr:GLRA2-like protein [Mya arenaria]
MQAIQYHKLAIDLTTVHLTGKTKMKTPASWHLQIPRAIAETGGDGYSGYSVSYIASESRQCRLTISGKVELGNPRIHRSDRKYLSLPVACILTAYVPTKVYVRILIQTIYSVTETSMEYSMDIFLRQKWEDRRLRYGNTSELPWLELDNKMMDRVWVPDTFFPNEKRARVHDVTVPNKMMHVYKNGTVLYNGYTTDNVIYRWDGPHPVRLNNLEMPHFGAKVADNAFSESCEESFGENKFACIQGFIQLDRKMGYYIVQVFVPSILIVVLSWVSFWVDHDAVPARISLGVLTVLTMTTQSSGALQSLPQVSYVKAIDVWMFTCLIFVFVALVEYSYVNVVARRALKGHSLARDRALKLQPDNIKQGDQTGESVGNIAARRVDKLSRLLFPVTFLVFNLVFWIYYSLVSFHTSSSGPSENLEE